MDCSAEFPSAAVGEVVVGKAYGENPLIQLKPCIITVKWISNNRNSVMYLHSNRAVIMIEAHLLFFAEQGLEIPYVEVCMAYISIQVSSKLTNSSTAVYFVALARS